MAVLVKASSHPKDRLEKTRKYGFQVTDVSEIGDAYKALKDKFDSIDRTITDLNVEIV